MNFLKNTLKTYANSFKNNRILLALVLNILFVIVTSALIKLTALISEPWLEKINKVDLNTIALQSEAQLQSIVSTLKGFALFIILTAILLILLLIISWSLCQGVIYSALLKKKFSFKYFEKFLLLNIIWFIPWSALLFIILYGGKPEYFIISAMSMLILFLHFSFILYVLFTESNKLKKIKESLKIGIARLNYFIIPYLLASIMFVIISQLNLLKINYLIIAIIYLLFFSWLQNYTKDVILKIEKI